MKRRVEWYKAYKLHRQMYKMKKPTRSLDCFIRWCDEQYPDDPYLSQSMIDRWCEKRTTEKNTSHAARTRLVNCLLDFINARSQDEHYVLVVHDEKEKPLEPVLFDEKELRNFFQALDELPVVQPANLCKSPNSLVRRCTLLTALEAPVYYRLMYSNGMRPNEVRWLDYCDVDLENGIIHIRNTKGYNERIVALHETMRQLLIEYDKLMSEYMPNRKTFFPDYEDKYHCEWWHITIFRKCWDKYNSKPSDDSKSAEEDRKVLAYSLRHNYAIENINSWNSDSVDVDIRVLALRNSMGHSNTKYTQYYYHFVPQFLNQLENMFGGTIEETLPNIEEDEK